MQLLVDTRIQPSNWLETDSGLRPQFEELISSTIDETKDIPEIISETGKIGMPHKGESIPHLSIHLSEFLPRASQRLCARSGNCSY